MISSISIDKNCAFLGVGLVALLRNLKPRDYFKTKKGDYREDRIQEHLYSYRILYIVLPILVALLIISSPDTASFDGEFRRSFYSLQTSLLILVIIVMAFLLSDFIIKDYYFHFAKTSIKIAQQKSDRIDKIKYIFLALNSYSKYLQKRLGLQIRNLEAIQDKIARASHQETLELVDSLDKMAEGEKVDMASYLGTRFLNGSATDQLLTRNVYLSRLKELLTVIIPVIAVVITVVDLLISR